MVMCASDRSWRRAVLAITLGTALAGSTVPTAAASAAQRPAAAGGLGYGLPAPPKALNDAYGDAPFTLPVNGYNLSALSGTSVDQSVLPVGVLDQRNFFSTLQQWEQQGARPVPPSVEVTIPAVDYADYSGGSPGLIKIAPGHLAGNTAPALGWPTTVQYVDYKFVAPQTGLYALSVTYYDYPSCFSEGSTSLASFTTNQVVSINSAWCGKDVAPQRAFLIDPPGTVPVVRLNTGLQETPASVIAAAKSAGLNLSQLPPWINPSEMNPPVATAPAWAVPSSSKPTSAPCALDLTSSSGLQSYNGYQYQELEQASFPERWTETGKKVLPNGIVAWPKDNEGDDLYPIPKEVETWQTINVHDAQGAYETPLLFCLTKGPHVLRVQEVRSPMAIESFAFHGLPVLPTYQQALAKWRAEGMKPVTCGLCVMIQGDNYAYMSDPTITPDSDPYPSLVPPANGYYILNILQGLSFQYPNQWVEWKFTVPQTGLYKLGFMVLQAGQGGGLVGLPATRSLLIDGQVPFQGAQWISFPFNNRWQMLTLSQPDGQPALIGLTKGTHTLTLKTTLGLLGESLAVLQRTTQFIDELQRQILLITGPNPNPNVTYDLGSALPFLVPDMEAAVQVLRQQAAFLTYVAGGTVPDGANTLLITANDLQRLANHPDYIPLSMTEWQNDEQALAGILTQMAQQALSINWIGLAAPTYHFPSAAASFWKGLRTTWKTFILSFYRNYTDVGSVYQNAISVWVGWGQTWAKVMSQLTNSEFTPATGIHVNFNVVPGGSGIVLLAEASGQGPDVATGMTTTNPVDFALRGGAYDLSQMPGWPVVAARFVPGALIPYTYTNPAGQTGVYGVPETEGMTLMFYRKDILSALHLPVPKTWPELYQILPIIESHGMEFYYPAGPQGFLPFLYQNGGQYYEQTPNGIRSAIDSEAGYIAFKQWTDLFDQWRVPLAANFFTRFETGEMPIGIADYPMFVLLQVAAPQLSGLWGLAPIPATPYECTASGSCTQVTSGPCAFGDPAHPPVLPGGAYCKYNDTAGDQQESTTIIIPRSSKHPLQAWRWVEWWTSTQVQLQFANDIEAIGGVQLAWNTANRFALAGLPWPSEDISVMQEAWSHLQPEPVVPGGYISDRYINDIWTNVVISGENPRAQLQWAVENINDELYRQEVQFGLAKPTANAPVAGA
jgi:ABC-type glycerol-3-phosphate transport system substrate-binding protein